MSNDLILSLETATRGGSLALVSNGVLLASSTGIADESHSVNLLTSIESLLKDAAVTLRDVDIFATAAGPGSFTGLRIGLATMKAFAATFNRPCVGVPTLEAIAFAAGSSGNTYALLPAGRGEVFAQMFSLGPTLGPRASRPLGVAQEALFPNQAGETPAVLKPVPDSVDALVSLTEPEHIPPDVLLGRITEASAIHWAGPGAHLYRDLIQQRATELGIEFVEGKEIFHLSFDNSHLSFEERASDTASIMLNSRSPTVREGPSASPAVPSCPHWTLAPNIEQLAEYVAILALQRASDGEEHTPENLHAIYVRPSDAEITKRKDLTLDKGDRGLDIGHWTLDV